ncbi:MAG: hypothetical protein AAFU41_00850 [Pseudomonadota bacterium]
MAFKTKFACSFLPQQHGRWTIEGDPAFGQFGKLLADFAIELSPGALITLGVYGAFGFALFFDQACVFARGTSTLNALHNRTANRQCGADTGKKGTRCQSAGGSSGSCGCTSRCGTAAYG